MNFFKKRASVLSPSNDASEDVSDTSPAQKSREEDESWGSFAGGKASDDPTTSNTAVKSAASGSGRPGAMEKQESEITWNDRPQGLVRAERAMTAKKEAAAERELTEEEIQERAWAEAESKEDARLSGALQQSASMGGSSKFSNRTSMASSVSSQQPSLRGQRNSLATSMVLVTPGSLADSYEFQQKTPRAKEEEREGNGLTPLTAASELQLQLQFGPRSGDYAKSLGQGAFGKVYLGRRKLFASAAPLIVPAITAAAGEGAGVVVKASAAVAEVVSAGQLVAIKEVRKAAMKVEDVRALKKEVAMLVGCQTHESVMRFVAWYESADAFHIVTECCGGGELHTALSKNRRAARARKARAEGGHPDDYTLPGVSEDTARTILSSLLHTLAFLQEQHLAHRDVKPENILLRRPLPPDNSPSASSPVSSFSSPSGGDGLGSSGLGSPPESGRDSIGSNNGGGNSVGGGGRRRSSGSNSVGAHNNEGDGGGGSVRSVCESDVVLCDFGFATKCSGRSLSNVCGSTAYMAPEVVRGMNYDYRCDCWSAGVVAFILLSGQLPFPGDNDIAMERGIKRSKGFVPYDSDLAVDGFGGGGDGRGSVGRPSLQRTGSAMLRTGLTSAPSSPPPSPSAATSVNGQSNDGEEAVSSNGHRGSLAGSPSSFRMFGSSGAGNVSSLSTIGSTSVRASSNLRGSSSFRQLSYSSLLRGNRSSTTSTATTAMATAAAAVVDTSEMTSLDSVRGFEAASFEAREFVCCALLPSPDRRPKARDLLTLPWFTNHEATTSPTAAAAAAAATSPTAARTSPGIPQERSQAEQQQDGEVSVVVGAGKGEGGVVSFTAVAVQKIVEDVDGEESEESKEEEKESEPNWLPDTYLAPPAADVAAAAAAAASATAGASAVLQGSSSDHKAATPLLRRCFSDIGVGADSLVTTPPQPQHRYDYDGGPTPSAAAMVELAAIGTKVQPRRVWNDSEDAESAGVSSSSSPLSSSTLAHTVRRTSVGDGSGGIRALAAAAALKGDGNGPWWVGVLCEGSAFVCPLTKKPFEDPVISLEDGCTYERRALARRNLSRAVVERQKAAWADAKRDALDELVWDDSYTMPEKLSRLVALKAAGVLGRPATGVAAQAAFDAAKAEVLANASKRSGKQRKGSDSSSLAADKKWANEVARQAVAAGALSKEETQMFLGGGASGGDKNGRDGEGGDDDEDDDNIGVSPAMALVHADQTRSERGSVDSFGSVGTHHSHRRKSMVPKADRVAGVVSNKAMRDAVSELKKVAETQQAELQRAKRADGWRGGRATDPSHAATSPQEMDSLLQRREEDVSKVHRELAAKQRAKEAAKQQAQQKLMREQLLNRQMSLQDLIGGSTQGRDLSDLTKPFVSPLDNAHSTPHSSAPVPSSSDVTAPTPVSERWGKVKALVVSSAVIASVVVTVERTDDYEARVVYRCVVKNRGGSTGACTHRFNEYRLFNERLGLLRGVANMVGGQHKLGQIQAHFPDKAHHKRAFLGAAQLTEEQLEARRAGLEAWMRALLMPWHDAANNEFTVVVGESDSAAASPATAAAAATAAAGNIGARFLRGGGGGGGAVSKGGESNTVVELEVASPIRALLWECLRLDSRVTHL